MAAMFARRPVLTTAAATAVVGTALYMSRPTPLRLDSGYREPSKTLSFPRSMLFSRELKVKQVEQVNHDTKRITFELPGGETETSGVPASCMQLDREHSFHHHRLILLSRHPHPTHGTRRLVSNPPAVHPHLAT
jgi:cytochrome-b5 reductase